MENKICPRCKINELNPILAMNSVSRRDKKTYICDKCGVDEAMCDFFGGVEDLTWLEEVENGS